MAHDSVASSKPKVKLDSDVETCVVGENCLVIYDHDRPVNIYCYGPKDDHRCAKTANAVVCYDDPHSGQKYIMIINQAIQINCQENHL